MYNGIIQNNPLVNQFNGFMMQNPDMVPFQHNKLINQNIHVKNNLDDLVYQHKQMQQNMPSYQTQMNNSMQRNESIPQPRTTIPSKIDPKTGKKINIIEEMLKPQKLEKKSMDNTDVNTNFKVREDKQLNYVLKGASEINKKKFGDKNKKVVEEFVMTNAPYKSILKDKIITKDTDKVLEEDLLVRKIDKKIDADQEVFSQDLKKKEGEKEQINDELQIEFHLDKKATHKKNFEYKQSFIRTATYDTKDFNENKEDYIEFYRNHQKKVEEGLDICDKIFKNIVDSGLINPDELPMDTNTNMKDIDLDLKAHLNTNEPPESVSAPIPKPIVADIPKIISKPQLISSSRTNKINGKTQPTVKPVIQPASQPTAKPPTQVIQQSSQPISKPIAQPVSKPVQSAMKTSNRPVSRPSSLSATNRPTRK